MGRRGDRIGNISGNLAGNIGRRPGADRFDVGRPFSGSVYPRKGKGLGVQGEAAYPDLLDHWDRLASWQSWRKGMTLARSQLIGAAERWGAVEVLCRDTFTPALQWERRSLLLAGFTAPNSPEGRWTVAVQPRGTVITATAIGANQSEVFYPLPDGSGRLRLLRLDSSANKGWDLSRHSIGELFEDTAIGAGALADDPTDGIALLCMAVDEAKGLAWFDASRLWRRVRSADGRLTLIEEAVPAAAPLPRFRADRHLTQSLTLSCNCPSHLGLEFVRLRADSSLGAQGLFPQRAPSGLGGPQRSSGDGNPEGVRRRFATLPWQRIPGQECKHCHAVRWALGAPMAEPTDMPSPDSTYWREREAMAVLEGIHGPMTAPWFVDHLRENLLDEQALSMLDITLLAACVGDAVGVVPQRVPLAAVQLQRGGAAVLAPLAGPFQLPDTPLPAPLAIGGVLRMNEQHPTERYQDDQDALFGDWWVGRGSAFNALAFTGPGMVESSGPVMRPISNQQLPRLIP